MTIDCFRWSKENELGGAYFKHNGKEIEALGDFEAEIIDNKAVNVKINTNIGEINIRFNEKSVVFEFPESGCSLEAISYKDAPTVNDFKDNELVCRYECFDYFVKLVNADCTVRNDGYTIIPKDKSFEFVLSSEK